MYKDSYNQRLKQIREKYGASIKDTTSCIKTNEKTLLRLDSKHDEKYGDKYSINRKLHDTKGDWKNSENTDPSFSNFSSKYSSSIQKESTSFLPNHSKDERLKEIQKIRKEFAESRNKAVEDFNRNLEKSKSKYLESQKYGLKQRVNINTTTFNPEDFRSAVKEPSSNQSYRGRSHLTFSSVRLESDPQLNQELRRNYDYNYAYESSHKNSNTSNRMDLNTFRSNSMSRFERENTSVTNKDYKDYRKIDNFRTAVHIDSETTSPIRGLMKFDSLQKIKKTEISDGFISTTATKLSSNTYDLTNIDKIQDRIHKILAKK